MNKRQKKKKEKRILMWKSEHPPKPDRYGDDFNHEGYRDSTAAAAIRSVMRRKKSHKWDSKNSEE